MNVEWHQMDADPQIKPTNLRCVLPVSCYRLSPTNANYYSYSAQKLILTLPSHGKQKAKSTLIFTDAESVNVNMLKLSL